VKDRFAPLWKFVGFPIVLILAVTKVHAQDFKEIAPKPVPQVSTAAPQIQTPEPAAPANPKQVVLPELKGLILQVYGPNFMRNPVPVTGIVIDNLPILDQPQLRARLAPFLGKPVTLDDLHKIQQIVIAWYRDHNRPFVDVSFPQQDLNAGVVQALITEFRLGQVRVEGNEWFSSALLLGQVRLSPGDPIDDTRLEEDLAWLNQNPFRQVSLVAQKSDTPGETDLILKTQDQMPLRFYIGNDDTGTPVLSLDRWNLGVNWGNAFGLDQQLSYQLTASDDFWNHAGHPTFVAHSVTYIVPLPWRDKLNIFGSYSQALPRLGPDLGLVGVSGQASMRYVATLPNLLAAIPVPGLQSITEDVQVGYDFKTSNNNLSFGGVQVSNVTTEVDQFPVIFDAAVTSDFGQTTLSNTLVWSPGNLTAQNNTLQFQQQANNAFAKANYAYDTLNITQTTRLPYEASWVMRLTGQTSTVNLLPSEQLGAGGHDTVRGYNERAANGSVGFLASQELRTPPFSLANDLLPDGLTDQAQLLAFWDYGSVRDDQYTAGTIPSTKLSSLGVGARYTVSHYVDLRIDYGFQQRRLPGASSLGQLLQAALTLSY
jgi:hemolysin activation/secretion protein